MKVENKSMELGTLKVNVPYQVFASLDEAAKNAGSDEQLLKRLNADLPVFTARREIVSAVQRLTGVPFVTIGKKNKLTGSVKQVRDIKKDGDVAYVARALKAKPVTVAQIEAELAKLDGKLAVNLGQRAKAARKPGKAYINAATELLDGKKSIEAANKLFGAFGISTFAATGNRDADVSTLAARLQEYKAKSSI